MRAAKTRVGKSALRTQVMKIATNIRVGRPVAQPVVNMLSDRCKSPFLTLSERGNCRQILHLTTKLTEDLIKNVMSYQPFSTRLSNEHANLKYIGKVEALTELVQEGNLGGPHKIFQRHESTSRSTSRRIGPRIALTP
ncbi:unnamed protein product [Colias eurytheme]|nr:unnamed protein product [Colias eurytheme]